MKKGEVHFRQDGNLVATVWRDKRAVAVLSTNADAKTGSVTWKAPGGKKDVTIPQPIIAYNAHMGWGVGRLIQWISTMPTTLWVVPL